MENKRLKRPEARLMRVMSQNQVFSITKASGSGRFP